MKSKYLFIGACVALASMVLVLTACSQKSIVFKGVEIPTSSLSASTIEWINYYNSLTEQEQNSVSYLPAELRNFVNETDSDVSVNLNKKASFIGKVIRIDSEEKKVLVSGKELFWCNYDNVGKLKPGYIVEVVYYSYVQEEDYKEISPESVTIVSATYDLVGVYLDAILTIWEDDTNSEGGFHNLILDFSELSNLSDGDKNALAYEVESQLGVLVKQGFESEVQDDDICIKIKYMKYEEPTSVKVGVVDDKDNTMIEVTVADEGIPKTPVVSEEIKEGLESSSNVVDNENVEISEVVEKIEEVVEKVDDVKEEIKEVEVDEFVPVSMDGVLPDISVSTDESSVKVLFLFEITKSNTSGELCKYSNCKVQAESSNIIWVKG